MRRTFQFHPGERTSWLSIIFDHLTGHNERRCSRGRRLVTVSYQECRLPAWFSCCANISIYRMYRVDRSSWPHQWLETPTVIIRASEIDRSRETLLPCLSLFEPPSSHSNPPYLVSSISCVLVRHIQEEKRSIS